MDRILIVDDNNDTRHNIEELLQLYDYETDTAENGAVALRKIKEFQPDCMILDLKLPEIDGWGVMKSVQDEIENGLIIIVITAFGDVSSAVKAMKEGAFDFIEKPFNNEVLLLSINRAVSNQRVRRELTQLKKSIGQSPKSEEVFGKSPSITRLVKQLQTIAKTNISVLIQGETGSGKEVVANYLHSISKRCDKPFITVDCGAIPENLIESELFGYEKGAFTGAMNKTKGKFQAADGGTLFLDEIGNLPLSQQRTILRAVEQKTITPVGSNTPLKVDTRLFCATNDNLAEKVAEGEFREDLFYRLSEFVIKVPPLRHRLEDIPVIVRSFIEQFREDLNPKLTGISEETLKKLMQYKWPGNVRQLRNTIRRAMVTAIDIIQPSDIDLTHNPKGNTADCDSFVEKILESEPPMRGKYQEIIESIEMKVLEKLLLENKNNVSKVSRIYGADRKSINSRLDQYGLKDKLNL
ncbi:MAG: sigma-54-dependent transcriptional regulator [Fidelibacterota bacterium]